MNKYNEILETPIIEIDDYMRIVTKENLKKATSESVTYTLKSDRDLKHTQEQFSPRIKNATEVIEVSHGFSKQDSSNRINGKLLVEHEGHSKNVTSDKVEERVDFVVDHYESKLIDDDFRKKMDERYSRLKLVKTCSTCVNRLLETCSLLSDGIDCSNYKADILRDEMKDWPTEGDASRYRRKMRRY